MSMTAAIGAQRQPLSQMSPQERREYLAALDPATRRQAEQIYGSKDGAAANPAASASS
jgi:hypothetical protein